MMGLLLQREVLIPNAAAPQGLVQPYDSWMGIYLPQEDGPDQKIGYVHSAVTTEERDGDRGSAYELLFKLSATLLSVPTEIVVDGNAWSPENKGLSSFDFSVSSFEDHAMHAAGVLNNGLLKLDINTGGESIPISLPVDENLLLSGTMGSATLNIPYLEVGEEVRIDTFDPMTLSAGKAKIKCVGLSTFEFEGESIPVKVLETTLGGITSETWVTFDDEVVRMDTPLGLILRKITPDEALAPSDAAGAQGLMKRIAVIPKGLPPFRGAKRMVVALSGLPKGVHPPQDDNQKSGYGERLIIEVPDVPTTDDQEMLLDSVDFLGGDAFVQVNHPDIMSTLETILPQPATPWEDAVSIYEWMYAEIDKTIVLSFPSALDVLRSMEGDCNEHTVLYAALARSANIPTRIAIGVVWSDELNGFYYHAWPEVHVGKWIPMDPTLGQTIADATHIKLLTGNIESWPKLVPYLGQLQLEVLEIE